MSRYWQLLRENPDFTKLWIAHIISLVGDWFNTIALSALVVKYSPGSEGAAISGLLLARFIPPMLVSPFAGVLIDRFDRKTLLIMSNLLRGGVVVLMMTIIGNPDFLWMIYGLTVVQFILSAVFEPGQSALVPALLKPDDLVLGNTIMGVTWSVVLALGAAVGGVVSATMGTTVALMVDALSFVAAALLIWFIRSAPEVEDKPKHAENTTGVIEGVRFLRHHLPVASVLLVKFGNTLGNVDTLMTIFATQIFVLGEDGQLSLALMYSTFGFGALIGPLVMNNWNDGSVTQMRRLIIIGFIFSAIGWLVLGSALSLVMVCLALFIRGMGGSINWTYSTVIIQKSTPDAYMGRVFSLDMMGFFLATVASTVIHGQLVDSVGDENVRLVALGTFFVSLLPLLLWVFVIRWLQNQPLDRPVAV